MPVAVLFIPFIDLLLAVVRRTWRGRSPFAPDKMHLHHRLLAIGHSHRRAVLIMYFWAALLGFGAVALSVIGGTVEVLVVIGALLVVGIVVVLSPRARRAAIAARQAELAALKERSRAAHPASRVVRGARVPRRHPASGRPPAPSAGTRPTASAGRAARAATPPGTSRSSGRGAGRGGPRPSRRRRGAGAGLG